ncbi:MAG: YbbR-like domain-containing protein [Oscillochloridaceae bacterium umkhey_bin13]
MSNLRATLLRISLAIGLSFTLWAFVSFSQNPEELVTFPDVPPQIVGLGPNLIVVDSNGLPYQTLPPIDVTLRTDRQQLASLRPVDIRVVINLSGLDAGEHIVPVNVEPTRSNIVLSVPPGGVDPALVPIRIEPLSVRELNLRVDVQGNLPFSFERGEPSATFGGQPVTRVRVTGAQSRVDRVVEALATANIEQLRATYVAPLSLVAVDEAGQAIEGVRLDPSTVTVQVPINPVVGLKLVPIEPVIVGLPAAGYAVRGVSVEPPLIALTGSSGLLDEVELLITQPLDLSGAVGDVVGTLAIIFPEGTAPRLGEPDVVRVTVKLDPLSRPFVAQLPATVQVINAPAGLGLSVNPTLLSVTLTGSSTALDGLAQEALRALVDLAGFDPGSYSVPVQLELPPGVSLVGDVPVVQVILRAPPTPTPEPPVEPEESSPTPEPEPAPEPTPAATP